MQYSIIGFKKIDAETFRLDPEYYHPDYIKLEKTLNSLKTKPLSDYIIDGYRVVYENTEVYSKFEVDNKNYVRFLQASDINTPIIDTSNIGFVNISDWDRYPKGRLKNGELLIEVKGKLEKVAIVPDNYNQDILVSGSLFKMTVDELYKYYVFTFLLCRFGVLQKNRIKTNLLISFISKPELYGLRIPVFSDSFTKIFNKLIPKSFSLYNTSISIFRNIEQLILNEIGLNTWNQKQDLFYTTNFSEVIKYGRFDSEYYQPRYKKLEKTIKKYKGGWDIIGNLFSQNLNKFDVKNGEIYNYIEIGSVNISDGSIEPLVIPSYDLPANAKIKLDLDDLIISKVRPYRGALAIVESDNLIGSGAFIVLKEKKNYNKETLLSLLKTPPFLDYSLKFNTGTSYPTIDDDDILSYPIPVFDNTIQDKIRNQVKEAYQVRNQSKKLLDISKYGFELAIEKNEKVAKEWIASELNKSEVTNKNV